MGAKLQPLYQGLDSIKIAKLRQATISIPLSPHNSPSFLVASVSKSLYRWSVRFQVIDVPLLLLQAPRLAAL